MSQSKANLNKIKTGLLSERYCYTNPARFNRASAFGS